MMGRVLVFGSWVMTDLIPIYDNGHRQVDRQCTGIFCV